MVKKKQVGRKVEGWKAKSWYRVFVPEAFGRVYMGDTIANDPEKVVGRVMETTLGEVTQDYAKQQVKLRFRIKEIAGDAAYTDFAGHEMTRDFMRSLVKRRTSRIDSIVPVVTKDGKELRLTVTAFTLTRANLSQAHEIRSTMSSFITQLAAQSEADAFVKAMVSGEIAKELHKQVKTIHPIRRVEVIKSKVMEAKREQLTAS